MILVLAEHDNASLKASTLHTVSAAAQCGGDIHILVAGQNCMPAAQAAASIRHAATILVADAPRFADGLAENIAEQILSLAQTGHYTHVLAPATAYGKNILPRVAAKLDMGQISEVIRVISPDIFERPIYAGNAIATVQSAEAVKIVTIRTVSFDAAIRDGAARIVSIEPVEGLDKTEFLSRELNQSLRPELTAARIVVAGGRGLGSEENFKILDPLADKLGAAVGASRAAVDAGYVSNDLQVGQSGKCVAPDLYVAVGISGAMQHMAGISDSKIIVAINKDPEAPIFNMADYGIVGDLFDIVPQLLVELNS